MASTLIFVCFFLIPRSTLATRSSLYPDQMVTSVTRIQSVSRSDGGSAPRDDLYSSERQQRSGHLDEPRETWSPIWRPCHLDGLGTDLRNQMSPLHNLTFLQLELNCCFVWPEENWHPTEPGFSQGFFPILSPMEFWFLVSGLLSWGHLISSGIVNLIAQILFKLNCGWTMTSLTSNNEMPSAENWVLVNLSFYIMTLFSYFDIGKLLDTICIFKALYK